jgi:hypothetical protein
MTQSNRTFSLRDEVAFPQFVKSGSGLLIPTYSDDHGPDHHKQIARLSLAKRIARRLMSGSLANWLGAIATIAALVFAFYAQNRQLQAEEGRATADRARIQAERELYDAQLANVAATNLRVDAERRLLDTQRANANAATMIETERRLLDAQRASAAAVDALSRTFGEIRGHPTAVASQPTGGSTSERTSRAIGRLLVGLGLVLLALALGVGGALLLWRRHRPFTVPPKGEAEPTN